MRTSSFLLIPLSVVFSLMTAQAGFADGRTTEALLDKLEWRNIGPAIMGGRIDDVAVVESDPRIIYLGTASAGVWKTTNNGVTWEALFDHETVNSIGDVTVAPSNPSIVWVGTGESNNRQSSSWGNGVYRSNDGGRTWIHRGLEQTRHIGRLVVHPHDPNIAYVAATGHLWGPNEERGLYRTLDSYTEEPDSSQIERIDFYERELQTLLQELQRVLDDDVPNLNRVLLENNVQRIAPRRTGEAGS